VTPVLTEDDIAWLKKYSAEVTEAFTDEFQVAAGRFDAWQPLVGRFTKAVDYVLKNGRTYFRAVDEAHNELCIASATLSNSEPRLPALNTSLRYPAPLNPLISGL
jgi:hypothetical protein